MLPISSIRSVYFVQVYSNTIKFFFRQELQRKPAENVIDNRFRNLYLWVVCPSRRLEAIMNELVHEDFQRHAVLERHRDGEGKRVHQPGKRAAFLRHLYENFSRTSVLIKTNCYVAFLVADLEFVRDGTAFIWKSLSNWPYNCDFFLFFFLFSLCQRVQRLRQLASIAIKRNRLQSEFPAFDINFLHVLDSRLVRHVDCLADRA